MAQTIPLARDKNDAVAQKTPELKSLRQMIPLQKRKIIKKSLWGILGVLLAWGIPTVLFLLLTSDTTDANASETAQSFINNPTFIVGWFSLLVILLLWRSGYQILYFITYFYDIDGENVIIRKGVCAKREITLPFAKITDVYVDQDLLDFFFFIYDVHISTPTAESGKFAHIDGLNKKGALQLRKLILSKIHNNLAPE